MHFGYGYSPSSLAVLGGVVTNIYNLMPAGASKDYTGYSPTRVVQLTGGPGPLGGTAQQWHNNSAAGYGSMSLTLSPALVTGNHLIVSSYWKAGDNTDGASAVYVRHLVYVGGQYCMSDWTVGPTSSAYVSGAREAEYGYDYIGSGWSRLWFYVDLVAQGLAGDNLTSVALYPCRTGADTHSAYIDCVQIELPDSYSLGDGPQAYQEV